MLGAHTYGGIHCTKFEPFLKPILMKKSELPPATIYLGQRRRGDGLARAEEGSGEESARASAFCFGEILAD
ncbi:MAG: hypothetical protein A3D50_00125 [Candidatus Taylorbacteria bacterium RIFCSPHIGHO2_02_FULL_44_12]|uniref:Uncharacterized protein n=1 Tax=Candidatus Taylorbacteria bacterium RIFCSPHIGHO2_02_FULL_44_12 TaxID=1802308 RepID=A0A1G2MMG3_9BACT|nr:MAG: hypothetical protein A3D50_00125 [Candidatus Taylorbacteria bacterium RIFCSPHIGHO2_02_FULL_44_12]